MPPFRLLLVIIRGFVRNRAELALENLASRLPLGAYGGSQTAFETTNTRERDTKGVGFGTPSPTRRNAA